MSVAPKSTILGTVIIPSIIIFIIMFTCGVKEANINKPWLKNWVASTIPTIAISLLLSNPFLAIVVGALEALTVGLSSYLGSQYKLKKIIK